MSYDNWLQAPFQRQQQEWEWFLDFCEAHNLDPDDPDSESIYQDSFEPEEPEDVDIEDDWDRDIYSYE